MGAFADLMALRSSSSFVGSLDEFEDKIQTDGFGMDGVDIADELS